MIQTVECSELEVWTVLMGVSMEANLRPTSK